MKNLPRIARVTFPIVAAAAFLFGCGSSSSSGSESTDADSTVMPSDMSGQITITGSAFTVAGDVKSTDAVSVANHDSFKHTVTSDDGVFDVAVEGGATESLPSLSPGVYAFHCKIHTSMLGTLTVT